MIQKKENTKGFTLVETMIVIVIFSFVMSLALAVFLANVRTQRTALYQQRLVAETSYAMLRAEDMVRNNEINSHAELNTKFLEFVSSTGDEGIKIKRSGFTGPSSRPTFFVETEVKVDEERKATFRLQTTVNR